MKAMISQPMAGKTNEEIQMTKAKAARDLEDMGYEVVDTLFSGDWCNRESLERLGIVNIPLWFLARGCRLEHEAALRYDLRCIHE